MVEVGGEGGGDETRMWLCCSVVAAVSWPFPLFRFILLYGFLHFYPIHLPHRFLSPPPCFLFPLSPPFLLPPLSSPAPPPSLAANLDRQTDKHAMAEADSVGVYA